LENKEVEEELAKIDQEVKKQEDETKKEVQEEEIILEDDFRLSQEKEFNEKFKDKVKETGTRDDVYIEEVEDANT